jgi:hypothetical protein
MRIPVWLLGAISLLAIPQAFATVPFLVPDKPYHCGSDQMRGTTYTINFAEFKDSGEAFCSEQMMHALDQIDRARADNEKVVVLVYIHGWKNDANPDYSADVCKFKTEVDRLSRILKQPGEGKNSPMVGIYLAWRGLTLSVEPFETISYWPRRTVARRVGQKDLNDAVGRIVERVGLKRSRTTLIFVGHSFGARVLENAADAAGPAGKKPGFMKQHLQAMQLRQRALKQGDKVEAAPLPPADMIIYVNAATASTVTRQTIKEWEKICKEGSDSAVCKAHPFWLAFTSTADLATGIIMPIANAVFPALSSDHLHLLSAANTPWLHTHDVVERKGACNEHQKPTDFKCPAGVAADACFGGIRNTKQYCYEIMPVEQKPSAAFFWIMNVNGHVVKDHGDIWENEMVINLILSVMKQQHGTVNELRDRLQGAE